jgi:O-antigen/teichoic acid export membrane protein
MSLSQQALGGVIWATVEKFGGRIIQFTSTVILARILLPEDFGIIAMVTIVFAVANILIDSGFSQALIREETITEKDRSTTFYINLFIAVTIFIVVWFTAPYIARFFGKSVLVDLTRFMALTPIFFSLTIVQRAHYSHRINFRTQAFINLIASILSGASAILLALYGFGVWALATQYVLLAFVTSFLFWGVNPWLPKYFIKKNSFDRLFGFGSKLMITGLISTAFTHVYKVIIGKLYSADLLGFYSQAENIKNAVTENVVSIMMRVTYPALSKVKEDVVRLTKGYRQVLQVISLLVFPSMFGLLLVAEPMVITLIGEKWKDSVPIIQLLAILGLIHHMHVINLNILKVIGRSDLILRLELLKKAGVTIAILIGLKFGFWGLIIAQVVSSYISLYINMIYTERLLNYSKIDQFTDVFPILFLSIPMVLAVLGLNLISFDFQPVRLAVLVLCGIVVYLITCLWFKPKPFKDMIYILRPKFPIFNKVNV